MKQLKLISAFCLLAFSLISINTNAQIISPAPCPYNIVASNCVGACGNPTGITYSTPICASFVERFCLTNDGSSLCPNNDAFARIYVNGVLVASGNITAVGSSISFSAICGANIVVKVGAFNNGSPIQCVWLGNLNYSLRKA